MIPVHPTAILVVDDDVDHVHIVRIVIRSIAPDVAIEVCRDASEVIACLDDLPHGALVLMDRLLDGVESFDTVVEMRSRCPDVTVVMLSAALSPIDRAYALACGAAEAIEKPASLDGWRAAFASILTTSTVVPPRMLPRAA